MKREKDEELWLNIGSYPRSGPTHRIHLSPAQVQTVARSAGRTPEVMVKVLSGGATSCKAVRRHLEYIGRKGDVELRTDDGDGIRSREGAGHLPEDWDLDEAGATRQLGERLNIEKSHSKEWREKFAAHRREQGVTEGVSGEAERGLSGSSRQIERLRGPVGWCRIWRRQGRLLACL